MHQEESFSFSFQEINLIVSPTGRQQHAWVIFEKAYVIERPIGMAYPGPKRRIKFSKKTDKFCE
ncbi:hypothetical protein [Leptospira borgpetersenii]|uniref:hypothetical protein n=1 Tax=Leptospira borgpetersenii TaxID=174 RepID=UPI000349EAF0|nr:hypothetical protein [Leptospira borgpetersenii]